jgi:hypothetical protein
MEPFTRIFSFFTMEFWLSQSPFTNSFFHMVESRLWRSLFHELFLSHGGISVITKPFSRIFLSHGGISDITKPFHEFFFHMVESWLSRNLFHEFFFHMVESRLSRSLFTNFSFTWWNLGYHEAFSRFFLSHGRISAITKPFSRIFLSHGGISAITKPFHEFFFHMVESTKCTIWGKILFIYITKSIYIGSASFKTLPLD